MNNNLKFDMLQLPLSTYVVNEKRGIAQYHVHRWERLNKYLKTYSTCIVLSYSFFAVLVGAKFVELLTVLALSYFCAVAAKSGRYGLALPLGGLAISVATFELIALNASFPVLIVVGLLSFLMTIPYYISGSLKKRKVVADRVLYLLKDIDEDQLNNAVWLVDCYPAFGHYMRKVTQMGRPLVVGEYESALDFLHEYSKIQIRSRLIPFNNVPFFFG